MPDEQAKPRAAIQFILPVENGMVTIGDGTTMSEPALIATLSQDPAVFTTKAQDGSLVVALSADERIWEFFPGIGG